MRNPECNKCELGSCAATICMTPDIEPQPGMLMVVGDYPSPDDDIKGNVFGSTKWETFWDTALNICGCDKENIYPTYAVKCTTGDAKVRPQEEHIKECFTYLEQEILRLRPQAVLLMGQTSVDAFGLTGEISKLASTAHDYKVGKGKSAVKVKLYVTYTPAYVKHTGYALRPFAQAIVRAYNYAIGVTGNKELTKTTIITTIDEIKEVVGYIKQTKECCFDFETTELTDLGTFDPDFRATILSLSFQHGSSYVIPLLHDESPFTESQVIKILGYISKEVFQNPDIRKIAQNIKFDMGVAARYGFPKFYGRLDDTMLQHHLLWEYKKHGLKDFIVDFYPDAGGYEEAVKAYGYSKAPLKVLAPYAGADTDLTFRVCTIFEGKLLQDERLYRIYRNQVMFVLRPIFEMEQTGMYIDRGKLQQFIDRAKYLLSEQEVKLMAYPEVQRYMDYAQQQAVNTEVMKLEISRKGFSGELSELRIKEYDTDNTTKEGAASLLRIQSDIRRVAKKVLNANNKIQQLKTGEINPYKGFNLSSPQQVGDLLYNAKGFGFEKPYVRAKGMKWPSTDNKFLKMLPGAETGFIFDLLVYRTIEKNLSTYLEGFVKLLDKNSRIHTSFLQHGTQTGRLASRSPNLQNISKHTKVKHPAAEEVVSMIMEAFAVPEDYVLISMDFSQAELRIIADLAEEKEMIAAYEAGADLHQLTAAKLTNRTLEDFLQLPEKEQKALRSKAKAANFGLIYGQAPKGFMEYARNNYGVELSLEEATEVHAGFFKAYPGILDYHAMYVAKAKKFGYVRTVFGRKRHALNINSPDEYIAAQDEREVINSPVQGSCGEHTIFGVGMLKLRLPASCFTVNSVHDNIMVYAPKHHVRYVTKLMVDTCENLPTQLYFKAGLKHLKLVADAELSTESWRALKPYNETEWQDR